jgi:hypothetical protein
MPRKLTHTLRLPSQPAGGKRIRYILKIPFESAV